MNDPKETVNARPQHGNKVVGTSAVAVTASPTKFAKGVVVLAATANSAVVYVGSYLVTADSDETSGGFPLEAGKSVSLQIEDLSQMYAVSTAASQQISWIAI